MRVLLSPLDIAGQMPLAAHALSEAGIHCRFCNDDRNWLGYHSAPGYRKYAVGFPKDLNEYDVYDFYFGRSMRADEIRAMGKKIVWHICGSEARQLSIAQKQSPYAVVKADEETVKRGLSEMAALSPVCTIRDMELYDHVAPYFEKVFITPRLVDVSVEHLPPQLEGKPRVVHAPSALDIKGTSAVVTALGALDKAGLIEFELIYRMPHHQAMERYRRADIIVDQLRIGTYGQLSIEALAMGKLAVCYISEYMLEHLPQELPIINASMDNLGSVIEALVARRPEWPGLSAQSRLYAQSCHGTHTIHSTIKAYEA